MGRWDNRLTFQLRIELLSMCRNVVSSAAFHQSRGKEVVDVEPFQSADIKRNINDFKKKTIGELLQ